ncbi:hypothetical protein LN650_13120 [Klebsiella pneumoniae subsp. pneumoniae]|nr:hypothetical protein [Klebsiella pneumoniae subsp. pneumoniae]
MNRSSKLFFHFFGLFPDIANLMIFRNSGGKTLEITATKRK